MNLADLIIEFIESKDTLTQKEKLVYKKRYIELLRKSDLSKIDCLKSTYAQLEEYQNSLEYNNPKLNQFMIGIKGNITTELKQQELQMKISTK